MDMRNYFLEDIATRQIRLTTTGITRYRASFARAGIRIDTIRTRSQLEMAVELSFEHDAIYNRESDEYFSEVLFFEWDKDITGDDDYMF